MTRMTGHSTLFDDLGTRVEALSLSPMQLLSELADVRIACSLEKSEDFLAALREVRDTVDAIHFSLEAIEDMAESLAPARPALRAVASGEPPFEAAIAAIANLAAPRAALRLVRD